MNLRRIVTVYALALGVPLVLLGSGAAPAGVPARTSLVGQEVPTVTFPTDSSEPVTVTLRSPGRRTVERVKVGSYDIPATALMAYQNAADILAKVKPDCDLSWTLLAAIGRVESNHGRFGGATLSADGLSSPRVVGVALDGKGPVAAIPDTDQGRWDGDTRWDRAVGPMQFLPSTWNLVGVDADGDGVRSVDDINDAALGAGVYLCAGAGQSLATPTGMQEAVYRYNDSAEYVALVMAYESLYAGGDFEVVTPSDGVVAAAALSGPALTGVPLAVSRAVEAQVKAAVRQAIATTRNKHATTTQRAAGTRPTSAKKTSVEVTTAKAGATTDQGGNGTSGNGASGSGSGSSTATPSPSTGSGSGGGDGTTAGGDTGGTGTGGASSPADQGGSTGGDTAAPDPQAPSEPSTPASPTPDDQGSSTPTPTPDPTPSPTTVTGVLTLQGDAYYLDGKLLELGVLADTGATAAGDLDKDGSVETNGAELAGLVGQTVTMVVVERSSGSLGIYSVNGISLA